jgi:uncharacterized membrane protein YqhA
LLRAALSLRYIMLVGSFGALIGGLVMFWEGATKLATAVQTFWSPGEQENAAIGFVMAATDAFLFGVVLMIFAGTITFGFVLSVAPQQKKSLPLWMRIEDVSQLKRIMIEVIIVFLIVDFASDMAEQDQVSWVALVKPAAVIFVAGALRLISNLTPTKTDN